MLLEQMFKERNSSKGTQNTYTQSVRFYEKLTGHTIDELIQIADHEETHNIRWKNTRTRQWLIEYRQWLHEKYYISTAQLYLTAVMVVYRHYEINIPKLPYFSKKHLKKSPPINYNDLPDREILNNCLQVSTPLIRSVILFISSSGLSRADVLNLRIKDYLDATSEYHTHPNSIKYAIQDMGDTDIIPTFHLRRQKTDYNYFTFCSHEACKTINAYLLTRKDKLTQDRPLFKINERYINTAFERLNTYFNLGKIGIYNRIRPHMLRKFHASQLAESGMSTEHINLLQGRKIKGVAHERYIRLNPDTIKEEYIQALPYLVIQDVNKYKSKVDLLTEENKMLQTKQDKITEILQRLDKLEKL